MANIRHTVIIRQDLNMTAGLMAAQVAHISDAFMREKLKSNNNAMVNDIFSDEVLSWMSDPYISVLAVDNLEELNIIIEESIDAGLNVCQWWDLIPSKNLNRSIPDVLIGASIGPCDMDKVKAITGNLPLA